MDIKQLKERLWFDSWVLSHTQLRQGQMHLESPHRGCTRTVPVPDHAGGDEWEAVWGLGCWLELGHNTFGQLISLPSYLYILYQSSHLSLLTNNTSVIIISLRCIGAFLVGQATCRRHWISASMWGEWRKTKPRAYTRKIHQSLLYSNCMHVLNS